MVDADHGQFAGERVGGNRRNVLDRAVDGLRPVLHQGAQRVDDLELVGEELRGWGAVELVDDARGRTKHVRVRLRDALSGAEHDDVPVANGDSDRVVRVVGPADRNRHVRRDLLRRAPAPRTRDDRIIDVIQINDACPAGTAATPANEHEAMRRPLEDEDVLGGDVGAGRFSVRSASRARLDKR